MRSSTPGSLTAVILAAGVGSRMGAHTVDRPKCLLEIAPGTTVLDLQLDRLFETGQIARVVVVAGHRGDLVAGHLARRRDPDVSLLFNPFFAVSNNLHSLWLARSHLAEGGVIVNGDDVFQPGLLERALAHPADLAVTINRKTSYDADDMKVVLDGGRLVRIGKDVPLDAADGEAIGVIKASRLGASWLADALDEIVRSGRLDVFYLRAVQRVIDRGHPVTAADITPIPWAEIDEPRDLAAIRARAADFLPLPLQQAG